MSDDAIVLVAIIRRKKDWAILEKEHWYRIPVKKAPYILERAKYLAFYQSKIFGKQWGINYFAKIKSKKIVKRIELLPDEPEHPHKEDDYYKLNVENLQTVSPAIRPQRRRRIIFIPTTLNKLRKAKEINDLYYTSSLEEKLYKHMQREKILAERQLFVREEGTTYCLDFAVFCEKGKIDIESDGEKWHSLKKNLIYDRKRNNMLASQGWTVLRFSGDEINNNTESCIKQIKKAIKYLA